MTFPVLVSVSIDLPLRQREIEGVVVLVPLKSQTDSSCDPWVNGKFMNSDLTWRVWHSMARMDQHPQFA